MTAPGGALVSTLPDGGEAAAEAHSGPRPSATRTRGHRVRDTLGILVLVVPVVAYFWFIHRYGVNVIWNDAWGDIGVIGHARSGTLSLPILWAQHTENRILFPNLIVLALAYTTHYNVVTEEYLSGVLLVAATAMLILAHRRRSPDTPWSFYLPVVLLMFTLAGGNQYYGGANTLYGFAMSWYVVLLSLAAALFLLDRRRLTGLVLAGSIAVAVVGSFSSIQGLLIWPVGLVLLLMRGRTRNAIVAWIVSGAVTGVVFLYHYNDKQGSGGLSYGLSHPVVFLKFFLFSIGDNIVGQQRTQPPHGFSDVDLVLGVVVLCIALWVVVTNGLRRDADSARPLGVALTWFGLLCAVTVTISRTWQGFWQTPRFVMFEVLIWVGCYLTLLARWAPPSGDGRPDRGAGKLRGRATGKTTPVPGRKVVDGLVLGVLIVLVGAQVVVGVPAGIRDAGLWHQRQLVTADVTANLDQAPDGLLEDELGQWPPGFVRQMTQVARADRLSLFATPAAGALQHQGLFPSVVTQVLSPADGATVSGVKWLIANNLAPRAHTTVQFHLSLQPSHDVLIGTATETLIGYLLRWDSTHETNGWYQLRSEIVGPGGKVVASSSPVWVQVVNKH